MLDREKTVQPEDCLKLLCFYRVFHKDYQMTMDRFQITSGLIDEFNQKVHEEDEYEILFLFMCAKAGRVICSFRDFVVTEELRRNYQAMVNNWNSHPEKFSKSVIWDDRKHTPYFKAQLADAHQFEVYIEKYFREKYQFDIGFYDGKEQYQGESRAGIEIKNDKKYLETGNIYIEYQERMNPTAPFVDSGILKEDNTRYFICGVPGDFYIFRKNTLKYLYQELQNGKKRREIRAVGNATSKCYIIYGNCIQKYAISERELMEELGKKVY